MLSLAAKVFSQRDVHLSLFHLLVNASDCDVNIADKLGWTPLYQAATSGEDGKHSFIRSFNSFIHSFIE